MIPSLEGWPTKAKEAPSSHEVRLAPLDSNPVFLCHGGNKEICEYVKLYGCNSGSKIPLAFPYKKITFSKYYMILLIQDRCY